MHSGVCLWGASPRGFTRGRQRPPPAPCSVDWTDRRTSCSRTCRNWATNPSSTRPPSAGYCTRTSTSGILTRQALSLRVLPPVPTPTELALSACCSPTPLACPSTCTPIWPTRTWGATTRPGGEGGSGEAPASTGTTCRLCGTVVAGNLSGLLWAGREETGPPRSLVPD